MKNVDNKNIFTDYPTWVLIPGSEKYTVALVTAFRDGEGKLHKTWKPTGFSGSLEEAVAYRDKLKQKIA